MINFRTAAIVFAVSLVLTVISHWQSTRFPSARQISPYLLEEPYQAPVEMEPFEVKVKSGTYIVYPHHEYLIKGLVVTTHDSGSWTDYAHGLWGDFLNVKDICAMWGVNTQNELYKKLQYRSGDWTCYVRTRDRWAWDNFRLDQFSNTHVLATDKKVIRNAKRARRGDQIYMHGYLVDYSINGAGVRRSSTIREDTGNGACEVMFVTDFGIIRSASSLFQTLLPIALAMTILSGIAMLILYLRAPLYSTRAYVEHQSGGDAEPSDASESDSQ